MADLNNLIVNYYAARENYDDKHAASVLADQVRRNEERKLVDFMIENGIKDVGRDDATKILLARNTSISVTKDNFDAIRAWLQRTVGDDKDFLETIVSKPAVLEHVKKLIEEGRENEVPAALNLSTSPTLRVIGWEKRNSEAF